MIADETANKSVRCLSGLLRELLIPSLLERYNDRIASHDPKARESTSHNGSSFELNPSLLKAFGPGSSGSILPE
jgi:hypothetical protein